MSRPSAVKSLMLLHGIWIAAGFCKPEGASACHTVLCQHSDVLHVWIHGIYELLGCNSNVLGLVSFL
jgi:hypothetical protein